MAGAQALTPTLQMQPEGLRCQASHQACSQSGLPPHPLQFTDVDEGQGPGHWDQVQRGRARGPKPTTAGLLDRGRADVKVRRVQTLHTTNR